MSPDRGDVPQNNKKIRTNMKVFAIQYIGCYALEDEFTIEREARCRLSLTVDAAADPD
jgi:hypothetical protein